MRRTLLGTVAGTAIAAALLAVAPVPSLAQTLNDSLAARAKSGDKEDRLLVEAGEIVYDNDAQTVSAVGDVHLYYQGRTLQADRVIYDRKTKHVTAIGNARMTEVDGTVSTADKFELSDDFKDGFIDSLRLQQTITERGEKVTTRFAAPRAERTAGETTVFENGTYTACEPCKDKPDRPPFWQVRAARIIHNNSERMVYYEDATLEFAGIPIAWIPYISAPDPTVKRKTGFLAPHYVYSSALGYGVATPFFWNIAPNMDLTLTPTYLSNQGFLGQAEWRHRLMNGAYNIRVAGIFQQDKDAFSEAPYGARDKDFRGSIETTGRFYINQQWAYGWDIAAVTDKWFFENYKIKSESLSSFYFRESTSTVYLTGKSDTGFFDLRGYYFKGLSYTDWQKQQPIVHPVLDYNKRFNGPSLIGGEVTIDANITSLSRDQAFFQQTPIPANGLYGLYSSCTVYQKGTCIMQGTAGAYSRASAEVSWRRTLIDPFGQVWTPFASFRMDGTWLAATTNGIQNQYVSNFIDTDNNVLGRAMPAIGLEYRYPFVAATQDFGIHTFEPIAQIIARPNEARIGSLPNEDAQSLVFDDTTIFEWNKFSGYDRVEGGVRANYGAKYSITSDKGFYTDVLFGQSYQVAGRNSYAAGANDPSNTGLDSGLETKKSDYVARFHIAPDAYSSFTARTRFDERTFGVKRIELQANAYLGNFQTSVIFARYAAQPDLAIPYRREGLYTSASYSVTDNWTVNGSLLFDLSRHEYERDRYLANPIPENYVRSPFWSVAQASAGIQYKDECTTFGIMYTSTFNDPSTGTKERDQTLMVRLELRTLGAASFSQSLGEGNSLRDGIAQ